MSKEITRFDIDMDGSMEPSDRGQWVRFEDAQQRKPLTDDEFTTAIEVAGLPVEDVEHAFAIKDLVEAAHGIKENP